MVMLGGARARFVLRWFCERVLGVRLAVAGVPGVAEGLFCWLRRWSMSASCWALMASASTSCLRESGSVVALGGRPGERIARPMFLLVVELRSMGAGRRRVSGEVDNEEGGGEVGSSFTLLELAQYRVNSTCFWSALVSDRFLSEATLRWLTQEL
jgi:hypothetical protein